MNNFARVLRMACRYRLTLVGAVLSALGVAVLWGGNIGAVYPFVKVVLEGKSIQNWVADEIDRGSQTVDDLDREIEKTEAQLAAARPAQQPKLEATLRHLQTRLDNESRARDWYRLGQAAPGPLPAQRSLPDARPGHGRAAGRARS